MADKRTSARVAQIAGRLLDGLDQLYDDIKSLAGSALVQAKRDKPKAKKQGPSRCRLKR